MYYDPIKDLLRRQLDIDPMYSYARRALLLYQYTFRIPDDPDFQVFKHLNYTADSIVVDVGANGGQSAVAFASLCPRSRVISFEPNPSLRPDLDFVKWLLGDRFECHHHGLGEKQGFLPLYVPTLGNLAITSQATLNGKTAEAKLAELELKSGRHGSIKKIQVAIRRFDDLNILPDIIKIDVEGYELSVLKGMTKTIEARPPILMVERNDDSAACKDLLRRYNYGFYAFDISKSKLVPDHTETTRNWFALTST